MDRYGRQKPLGSKGQQGGDSPLEHAGFMCNQCFDQCYQTMSHCSGWFSYPLGPPCTCTGEQVCVQWEQMYYENCTGSQCSQTWCAEYQGSYTCHSNLNCAAQCASACSGGSGYTGQHGGGGRSDGGRNWSDINLKENIELIGKSKSGINIYEFDYKDKKYGNGRYQGVMAQEVPEASFNNNGYLMVDYSKLDVEFRRI